MNLTNATTAEKGNIVYRIQTEWNTIVLVSWVGEGNKELVKRFTGDDAEQQAKTMLQQIIAE